VREDLLPGHAITVAVAGGSVTVGFIAETPGVVSHLYIDPAWARQGIGSTLLGRAMDHQPTRLSLWTFDANVGARAFYEKHGFAAVEHTDGSGNEERQPDVRYSWTK
jgi:GNAT superfamily N-acetyltransferase